MVTSGHLVLNQLKLSLKKESCFCCCSLGQSEKLEQEEVPLSWNYHNLLEPSIRANNQVRTVHTVRCSAPTPEKNVNKGSTDQGGFFFFVYIFCVNVLGTNVFFYSCLVYQKNCKLVLVLASLTKVLKSQNIPLKTTTYCFKFANVF